MHAMKATGPLDCPTYLNERPLQIKAEMVITTTNKEAVEIKIPINIERKFVNATAIAQDRL